MHDSCTSLRHIPPPAKLPTDRRSVAGQKLRQLSTWTGHHMLPVLYKGDVGEYWLQRQSTSGVWTDGVADSLHVAVWEQNDDDDDRYRHSKHVQHRTHTAQMSSSNSVFHQHHHQLRVYVKPHFIGHCSATPIAKQCPSVSSARRTSQSRSRWKL